MGEKLVHGPEVIPPKTQDGLPLRGFFLVFQDIFNDRQGQKITVLEFLDQANALYIPIVVIGNVSSPLAGLGEEAFADIIMDRLFGHAGSLNQLADFQRITPEEGEKTQDQKRSTFFRVTGNTITKRERIVKKNLVGLRFFLTFMHSIE
jgi:hypothetical protein